MMNNITPIFGMNRYCGPAVLSALTGKSTDTCAAVISAISGKNVIKSVQVEHLVEAFKRLNFETQEVCPVSRTLYGNISFMINRDGNYIIVVPEHVVAVTITDKQAFFIDNHTKEPINAIASARLTQEVKRIIKITPKTQEQINKEYRDNRRSYLVNKINDLAYRIGNLSAERDELIKELDKFDADAREETSNA